MKPISLENLKIVRNNTCLTGIRYPEELSLKRSIHPDRLKRGEGFEEDEILAGECRFIM